MTGVHRYSTSASRPNVFEVEDSAPLVHHADASTGELGLRRAKSGRWSWSFVLTFAFVAALAYWTMASLYSRSVPRIDPFTGLPLIAFPSVVRAAGNLWTGLRWTEGGVSAVSFLGIPYANMPTRFRASIAYTGTNWAERARPLQWWHDPCPSGDGGRVEDCLKINVVVPGMQTGVPLPVLLFVHGGAWSFGSGSALEPFNVVRRAQEMGKPCVFVSFNYRLGPLGFTSAPTNEHLDWNVGLKDQIVAFEWVQREIAAWGGDPSKVTLVGHSAGAFSIGLHQIYSPAHLFRGVFMISGAATSLPSLSPIDATTRSLHPLVHPAHCRSPVDASPATPDSTSDLTTARKYGELVECLRGLHINDLMDSSKDLSNKTMTDAFFPWGPVVEGEGGWIDVLPSVRIARGQYNKVPVVIGAVQDEGIFFAQRTTASTNDVARIVRGMFPFALEAVNRLIDPLFKLYPNDGVSGSPYHVAASDLGNMTTAYKMAASIVGDIIWQAPRRLLLETQLKLEVPFPQWSYIYSTPPYWATKDLGVPHAADLPGWLGQDASPETVAMTSYLINFVSDLDPNGPGLPPWPQYNSTRKILAISPHKIAAELDDFRLKPIEFINQHVEELHC